MGLKLRLYHTMQAMNFETVQHVAITAAHEGQRLDNFLFNLLKGIPKSRIYRLVRKGEVRINKGRKDASYKLVMDDIVRLPPVRVAASTEPVPVPRRKADQLTQAICYEDDDLLIINKPAGLAVHGGSGISLALIEMLRTMRPQAGYLELVHRLDRETSGCIMIAKSRKMLLHLQQQLQSDGVKKQYVALVKGQWQGPGVIEAPLLKSVLQSGERMVKVDPLGKPSITHVKVLKSFADLTLLAVTLITGRTHQIRVHTAFMDHPIVNDEKYGDSQFNEQFAALHKTKQLFLHAHRLSVTLFHQQQLTIEAPLPTIFNDYN